MRLAWAIIPARLASQRLPGKMLLAESGRALVVHTALNVRASGAFERVIVATDCAEIARVVVDAGLEAQLTRADHPSGSDRVHEAFVHLLAHAPAPEVIVNVQGDEPELEPGDLVALTRAFDDPRVSMATLAAPLEDPSELQRANVVKVVCDARGDALYFSRAPIPAAGHATSARAPAWRHVGVYAFRPAALERFQTLPRGALEAYESLEQLRWLEAGEKLRVVQVARAPRGIDTREDYAAFVARGRAAGAQNDPGGAAANYRERARTG